jgi:hypothetical protein
VPFGVDFERRVVNLDTMKPGSYKPRPLALLVALLLSPSVARAAVAVHGLMLPANAQEVGENRYRSSQSYEDTLKYFNTVYKGIPRKAIVNQPGIRAVHYESVDAKSGWEGFNVYEKDKEVRIFVIPRGSAAKEEKKAGGAKRRGK